MVTELVVVHLKASVTVTMYVVVVVGLILLRHHYRRYPSHKYYFRFHLSQML